MKRVGVMGFIHESNTFAVTPTTYKDFEQVSLTRGRGLIERWTGGNHELSGFLEGARSAGLEPVPLVAAFAMPSGTVVREAFRRHSGRDGRSPEGGPARGRSLPGVARGYRVRGVPRRRRRDGPEDAGSRGTGCAGRHDAGPACQRFPRDGGPHRRHHHLSLQSAPGPESPRAGSRFAARPDVAGRDPTGASPRMPATDHQHRQAVHR